MNLGEPTRAAESTRKAYELRDRMSEHEKLAISAAYAQSVTGNLEAARTACELWMDTFPRDFGAQGTLGIIYAQLGQHEKALAASQATLTLNSGSGVVYGNLVGAYLALNHLDEAKATAREAQAHNLDAPNVHLVLYLVDFLEHNPAGMEHEAAVVMGKPGWEDGMLYLESETAAYGAEFAKDRELVRRAADLAQRAGEKETEATYEAEAAVQEALVGNMALAKQGAQTALGLANGKNVQAVSVMALGLAGDSVRASRLADDLGKRFPEDTIVQSQYLPVIRATALRSDDTAKAVEALAAAVPYELGVGSNLPLYPAYLRGEAYLAAKQGPAAEVDFKKILNNPGLVGNDPIGALAHLGLGRAYALAGDSAKAKSAYQDFFTLWKNADPDIPILQQAKEEYAKLK